MVSFFGLTQSDDTLVAASDMTANGVPIFTRPSGTAFHLVIEGQPGSNHVTVGNSAYDAELLSFPDLQIETSRALGNGSTAVCDSAGSKAGGVPGIDPPNFQPTDTSIAIVNDFGCRFVNGNGDPVARNSSDACTPDSASPSGFAFVNPASTLQFCTSTITKVLQFPDGDTVLTARLRDIDATPGPTAQIVVRIGASPAPATVSPTPTATPTISRTQTSTPAATPTIAATGGPSATASVPTPTWTPTQTARPLPSSTPSSTLPGPVVTFFGLAYSDNSLVLPDATTTDGLLLYRLANGLGFSLVVEGKPGANGKAVGRSAYQSDLSSLPDLQVEVSQALGNGSPDVCDRTGGVPVIDPPHFDSTTTVIDAVNDLACRFLDGSGQPIGRGPSEGCILSASGDLGFVDASSTIQFCSVIDTALEFPPGDTLVTVRLLDVSGNPGAPAQLVVHVGP